MNYLADISPLLEEMGQTVLYSVNIPTTLVPEALTRREREPKEKPETKRRASGR